MCRKCPSSPRCRSELIDSAWVVIVPGQKCIKEQIKNCFICSHESPTPCCIVLPIFIVFYFSIYFNGLRTNGGRGEGGGGGGGVGVYSTAKF